MDRSRSSRGVGWSSGYWNIVIMARTPRWARFWSSRTTPNTISDSARFFPLFWNKGYYHLMISSDLGGQDLNICLAPAGYLNNRGSRKIFWELGMKFWDPCAEWGKFPKIFSPPLRGVIQHCSSEHTTEQKVLEIVLWMSWITERMILCFFLQPWIVVTGFAIIVFRMNQSRTTCAEVWTASHRW